MAEILFHSRFQHFEEDQQLRSQLGTHKDLKTQINGPMLLSQISQDP